MKIHFVIEDGLFSVSVFKDYTETKFNDFNETCNVIVREENYFSLCVIVLIVLCVTIVPYVSFVIYKLFCHVTFGVLMYVSSVILYTVETVYNGFNIPVILTKSKGPGSMI